MKTFLEFMAEQSFSDLVASDPGFSKNMKSFVKNNEITRKIQAREPTELPKFTPSERVKPVDFTGSRYDLGNGQTVDPSKVTNKINPQREIKLRKDYRSPPAGYPDSIKDRLAAAEAGNEPPMPGSGPYKTKQSDALKTSPAVPVEPIKPPIPKAKPKQITSRIKQIQDRVPQEVPGLKGMQYDNPDVSGSLLKGFRYEPDKQDTDQKIPRPKLRPERKPAITNTDNTKGAVSIPKPKSMDLNFTSKNKKQTVAPAENQKASSGGSYKIKPGDNPTEIANALGLTLDQLEKKNPGILKRAKRLKIGDTINR